MSEVMDTNCLCGSGLLKDECCEQYLLTDALPKTPEALMRSRYTAFAKKDIDYIKSTMKGKALQKADFDQTKNWMDHTSWEGLEVVKTKMKSHNEGVVHFIATYIQNDQTHQMEEISEFKKIGGKWFYVAGRQLNRSDSSDTKVGRNAPCPCGSGKKYKQCCGK